MLKSLLGITRKPELQAYRSFAHQDSAHLIGRVTECVGRARGRSIFWNALSLVRAYLAKPYVGMQVEVLSGEKNLTAYTNENGVFEIDCPLGGPIEVQLEEEFEKVEVFAPARGAVFGIISDIDDTILVSNATRTLRLLYLLFVKNAHSRKPFPGVAEFYKALSHGGRNPFFYVSSSAWNLYNLLTEFMDLNHIPKGPLLLKEVGGLRSVLRGAGNHAHKYKKIEMVLRAYPELPFILLGDSGQQDAEIYSALAVKHPGRIKAIYIRDVTIAEDALVEQALMTLGGETELVLTKTSEEAAAHARKKGFIVSEGVTLVKVGVDLEEKSVL